ncbi:hypothetical protein Q5741_20620 [Paenibacillus sp. JX-17]|uniref:Uncharacterized protein n=1 Tax=Paenibacillus lacisoli TaxID=3064525 RepID=A0ABT9CHN6_9BACL|nr:hypothetical protein [Paenibacillus sp. JX-17]MDO7908792.1 hypothetical protein [Paenibacillus sp. JX-17]
MKSTWKARRGLTGNQSAVRLAHTLTGVAGAMMPFYAAIRRDSRYASTWSKAVTAADLDHLIRLLKRVSPQAGRQDVGTNGIGYFVAFKTAQPESYYTNGTTIPPGMVQFTFSTHVHRTMAGELLPLYRELACNRAFAAALARAVVCKDRKAVCIMVRSLVRTKALRTIQIEEQGVAMTFKYPFSRYPYRNLLFSGF